MTLLATLLLVAATGCVEPLVPDGPGEKGDVKLSLQIAVPGADGLSTKATIPAQNGEADIHTLEIWAFPHLSREDAAGTLEDEDDPNNPQAVAYGNVSPDNNGLVTLTIPKTVITGGQLNLDFFVLANGGSVGYGPNASRSTLKRKTLRDKVFGNANGNGFGATEVSSVPTPQVQTVPTTEGQAGLPMSCYFDNDGEGFDISFLKYGFTSEQLAFIRGQVTTPTVAYSLDNITPALSIAQKAFIGTSVTSWAELADMLSPTVSLTRAISKIHFVFAKAMNLTGIPQIISVRFTTADSEEVLPVNTYVFPWPTGSFHLPGSSYGEFSWGAATSQETYLYPDIQEVDSPQRLLKTCNNIDAYHPDGTYYTKEGGAHKVPDELTEQEYEDFLTEWLGNGKVAYLRETDKAVKARITFSIDGVTKDPVDIFLPTGAHLYRNNWWTIYAFFMTYSLEFQVTAASWDGLGSSVNIHSHLQ